MAPIPQHSDVTKKFAILVDVAAWGAYRTGFRPVELMMRAVMM